PPQNTPRLSRLTPPTSTLKVYEAAHHDSGRQRNLHAIADVEALEAAHQTSLHRRPRDPHPRALVGGAGDERVEALADAALEQEGRGRLSHLTLDLRRIVLLFGAVPRESVELVRPIRGRAVRQRTLDQALRDQVRESAVRCGGVRVVA